MATTAARCRTSSASRTTARSSTRWPATRSTSSAARPGCGRATRWKAWSTRCSSTRRARCRWPTSIAMSGCARNVVLLGDPQQLEQPIQGVHPDGAGASSLGHLLGEAETVPPDTGPVPRADVAHASAASPRFTSELFYEGKLESVPGLERQEVVADGLPDGFDWLAGSGMRWVPVEHDGNTNQSVEEADRVCEIWNALIGRSWIDAEGARQAIGRGRHRHRVALQRPSAADPGDAGPDRARRHGRQVPGPGGARLDLHDGHVAAGGRSARHGLSLFAQPLERGDVARQGAGDRRRLAAAAGHRARARPISCGWPMPSTAFEEEATSGV